MPNLALPIFKDSDRTSADFYKTVNAVKLIPRRNFPSNTRSEAYVKYLNDDKKYAQLLALPFAFSNNGTQLKFEKIDLNYNCINIDVTAEDTCQLVMQQVYYKRWKSTDAAKKTSAYDGVLLQADLKKGHNSVRLVYYCKDILWEAIISVLCLLLLSIFLFRKYRATNNTKVEIG